MVNLKLEMLSLQYSLLMLLYCRRAVDMSVGGPGEEEAELESESQQVQYSTVQDRTGQDRTGQDRTGQDRTGRNRTGQDRTIQFLNFLNF